MQEHLYREVERRLPRNCSPVRAAECIDAMLGLEVLSRQERFVAPVGEALLRAVRDPSACMVGVSRGDLTAAGLVIVHATGVQYLAVNAAAQHYGIGRALIEGAVAALRASGAEAPTIWVHEHNWAARRLYGRAGFAYTGNAQDSSLELRWTGEAWPPYGRRSERSWRVVVGPGGGGRDLAERLRFELPLVRVEVLDAPPADGTADALLQPPAEVALYAHLLEHAHDVFDNYAAVRTAARDGTDSTLFWAKRGRAAECAYKCTFEDADELVYWLACAP